MRLPEKRRKGEEEGLKVIRRWMEVDGGKRGKAGVDRC